LVFLAGAEVRPLFVRVADVVVIVLLLLMVADLSRLPPEFKHINKGRKRNQLRLR